MKELETGMLIGLIIALIVTIISVAVVATGKTSAIADCIAKGEKPLECKAALE